MQWTKFQTQGEAVAFVRLLSVSSLLSFFFSLLFSGLINFPNALDPCFYWNNDEGYGAVSVLGLSCGPFLKTWTMDMGSSEHDVGLSSPFVHFQNKNVGAGGMAMANAVCLAYDRVHEFTLSINIDLVEILTSLTW